MSKQPNKLLTKRVNSAINAVIYRNKQLTYPELFIELGILSAKDFSAWKIGQVPFLEKVVQSNLTKLARIMTAVRRFARENHLERTISPQPRKPYSKTGMNFLETEYRAVYRAPSQHVVITRQKLHAKDDATLGSGDKSTVSSLNP